jgi:hypothetical protein
MVTQLFGMDQCIFIECHVGKAEAFFTVSSRILLRDQKVVEGKTRYEMNLNNNSNKILGIINELWEYI